MSGDAHDGAAAGLLPDTVTAEQHEDDGNSQGGNVQGVVDAVDGGDVGRESASRLGETGVLIGNSAPEDGDARLVTDDDDAVGHEVRERHTPPPDANELEAVTQPPYYANTQVGVESDSLTGRSSDFANGVVYDENATVDDPALRNPTLGVQADADAELAQSAPNSTETATPTALDAASHSTANATHTAPLSSALPPPVRPPHSTVTVTATIAPIQVRTVVQVAVHRFEKDNSRQLTTLRGDTAPRGGGGWVLIARELFEAVATHLCVHPQSFHLTHRNERVRFMATLFLPDDHAATARAAPLWITIAFPSASTPEQLPPHLAVLTANEVLERCILVRRAKPHITPAALVAARERGGRETSYEETLRHLYDSHGRDESSGVVRDGTGGDVAVALVHTGPTRCQFIGGYRVKHDPSRLLLHAATQLFKHDLCYSPFPPRSVAVSALCSRQTQTLGLARGSQTRRECRVQTPRPDLALAVDDNGEVRPGDATVASGEDTMGCIRVVARPYFSAAALYALRTDRVITLQKFYRQWKARQVRRQLEQAEAAKQRRAEALQRAEEAAQMANDDLEQRRRAAPRRWQDFRRRRQEITAWCVREIAAVLARDGLTPQARRAALKAITDEELKQLQELTRRQRQTALDARERRFSHTLHEMASAKRWGAVLVETPNTARAAELRDLYEQLCDSASTTAAGAEAVQARLDALLQVKWMVKPHDSELVRELCQLIDRESDLLHRNRTAASLAGLRTRLEKLFRRFIEDPEYNPGMAEYTRSATGRAKASQLYGTTYTADSV